MKKYIFKINIEEKSLTCNGLEISWEETGLTDQETEDEVREVIERNNEGDEIIVRFY